MRTVNKILLDGNIYNKLSSDAGARENLAELTEAGAIEVIVTPVVRGELSESPFGGVPNWFRVSHKAEAAAVVGECIVGEAILSDGAVYSAHRGASKKIRDGIIAQSAHKLADVFVSEDNRCRKRFQQIKGTCTAMDYSEFLIWMRSLKKL